MRYFQMYLKNQKDINRSAVSTTHNQDGAPAINKPIIKNIIGIYFPLSLYGVHIPL